MQGFCIEVKEPDPGCTPPPQGYHHSPGDLSGHAPDSEPTSGASQGAAPISKPGPFSARSTDKVKFNQPAGNSTCLVCREVNKQQSEGESNRGLWLRGRGHAKERTLSSGYGVQGSSVDEGRGPGRGTEEESSRGWTCQGPVRGWDVPFIPKGSLWNT